MVLLHAGHVLVNGLHQLLATLTGQGRDLEDRTLPAIAAHELQHARHALGFGDHVQLVEHQPARLVVQLVVVNLEFVDDGACLLHGIGVVKRSQVDHVQQHAGALQVAQELVTQTRPLGGAFDQTRNVGNHKALFRPHAHHAQVGVEGREGVVGDLGTGIRDGRDQGRLAGIRHAQQAHIGQHAQFELELVCLARPARRLLAGRTVGGGLVVQVAEAAVTALGQQALFAVLQQLHHQFAGFGVADDGAHRHAQHDVFAGGTKLIGATALFAVAGFVTARVAVVNQRVDVAVCDHIDVPASPAVAPVGAAEGNELLTTEADASATTVTGGHINGGFIDEFHETGVLA